jgi:hypothetical protein
MVVQLIDLGSHLTKLLWSAQGTLDYDDLGTGSRVQDLVKACIFKEEASLI